MNYWRLPKLPWVPKGLLDLKSRVLVQRPSFWRQRSLHHLLKRETNPKIHWKPAVLIAAWEWELDADDELTASILRGYHQVHEGGTWNWGEFVLREAICSLRRMKRVADEWESTWGKSEEFCRRKIETWGETYRKIRTIDKWARATSQRVMRREQDIGGQDAAMRAWLF